MDKRYDYLLQVKDTGECPVDTTNNAVAVCINCPLFRYCSNTGTDGVEELKALATIAIRDIISGKKK